MRDRAPRLENMPPSLHMQPPYSQYKLPSAHAHIMISCNSSTCPSCWGDSLASDSIAILSVVERHNNGTQGLLANFELVGEGQHGV